MFMFIGDILIFLNAMKINLGTNVGKATSCFQQDINKNNLTMKGDRWTAVCLWNSIFSAHGIFWNRQQHIRHDISSQFGSDDM